MKFEFNYNKCSDVGLVVNHGNKDNIVLFFDEIDEAACYKANLFRTDAQYESEGFVKKADITEHPITIINKDNRKKQVKNQQFLNEPGPAFKGKDLVVQSENLFSNCEVNGAYYSSFDKFKLSIVSKISFEKVKFITSMETSRNDLYINIDFLPCGQYFVILQIEGRSGNIIKESVPYYFKVKMASNDDIIKAISSNSGVAF